jgi:hypothetical protein
LITVPGYEFRRILLVSVPLRALHVMPLPAALAPAAFKADTATFKAEIAEVAAFINDTSVATFPARSWYAKAMCVALISRAPARTDVLDVTGIDSSLHELIEDTHWPMCGRYCTIKHGGRCHV